MISSLNILMGFALALSLYVLQCSADIVSTGSISFGQQLAGDIESGESDYYEVSLPSFTSRIFFETCGSDYHTKLEFLDSDGNSVAYCDDCNGGGVACGLQGDLTVERLTAGTYYLRIAGFRSAEYGSYILSMSSGFMDCGDVITTTLAAGETYYYETQSSSSGAYALAVLETCDDFDSADSGITLSLYDATGASLVSGNSLSDIGTCTSGNPTSGIEVTSYINTESKYFLAVSSASAGSFTLELACEAVDTDETTTTTTQTPTMTDTTNTIDFGEQVSGAMVSNGEHYYAFDLSGDTARVFFQSCDSDFDAYMKVFDSSGSSEVAYCQDCDTGGDDCGVQGDLTINNLAAGRYYLAVSGYQGEYGTFVVSMSNGYIDCTVTVSVAGSSDYRDRQFYEYRSLSAGSYSVVNLEACGTDGESTLAVYNTEGEEEETDSGDSADGVTATCATGSVTGDLDVTSFANAVDTVFFTIGGFAAQSVAFELQLLCEDATTTTTTTTTVSPDSMGTVGTISFGEEVTGIIAAGGEDKYAIDLTAEETSRVFFEACGSSFDTYLTLYDASGQQTAYCDNCNDGGDECGLAGDLTVENLEAGRYYVGIQGMDATQSGSYVVSMSNGFIDCGDIVSGEIEAGEKAYFEYYASTGTSDYKSAYLESCGSQYDTQLYVFDNAGGQLAYGDDLNNFGSGCATGGLTGDLEVTSYVNSATKYFFSVGGPGSDESSYTVELVCEEDTTTTTTTDAPDGATSATETISYANKVSGTIAAYSENYYVIDLAYDTALLLFEACGSDYQTYLKLYDAGGSEIASCYDCNTGSDSCALQGDLTVNNLAAGRYYLGVAGYESAAGSYYVTMSNGYIGCDQTVTGFVVNGLKTYYQFLSSYSDNAGISSYLELCGTAADTSLYVYDSTGSAVVFGDDDLGTDSCSTGTLIANLEVATYLNSADKYFFGIADFEAESGTYSMQLICSEDTTAAVSVHDVLHHDWWGELGFASEPGQSLVYSDEMVWMLATVVALLILLNCYHIRPWQSKYSRSRVAFQKVADTEFDTDLDVDSDVNALVE